LSLRRTLSLAGGLLLAGCASLPGGPLPDREQMRDFALDARFALRVTAADQPPQSSGGRLSWTHRSTEDRLLIANPLGIGLAEVDINPGRARLRTGDGRQYESTDPDSLIAEVTGQALPVGRLPAWLLGRAAPGTDVERETNGRPLRFNEAGWLIEYAYPDDAPGALPAGLTLIHKPDIELRLRIETWQEAQ